MGWSCPSTAAYRPSESADLGECIIAGSPIHFHRRSESNLRKAAARTQHLGDVGMKGENRVACLLRFLHSDNQLRRAGQPDAFQARLD